MNSEDIKELIISNEFRRIKVNSLQLDSIELN